MSNLLERAINSTTAIGPPRSFRTRSASSRTTSPTTSFPRLGRPIASSALASSASGCRPRRASWPNARSSRRRAI